MSEYKFPSRYGHRSLGGSTWNFPSKSSPGWIPINWKLQQRNYVFTQWPCWVYHWNRYTGRLWCRSRVNLNSSTKLDIKYNKILFSTKNYKWMYLDSRFTPFSFNSYVIYFVIFILNKHNGKLERCSAGIYWILLVVSTNR